MNLKDNFINNYSNIKSWADHNKAAILFGTGMLGFGATLYSMWKDAPKAKKALEEAKANREEDMKTSEIIFENTSIVLKNMWRDFLLAAGSATCLYLSYHELNNSLSAAIALNASNVELLKLTKEKVKEELGENKAAKIEQKITEERVNENSEGAKEIIITNPGELLFKDGHTGRYFAASRDDILHAENELNRRVYVEMFVSLNEFYDELGLSHVKLGNEIGWTTENPPRFSMEFAELAEDHRPCCLLDYDIELRTAPW